MEGIDIYSAYQTVNNWNAVRAADIGWCYQKVSDGTGTRRVQSPDAGKQAGVLQGGYHFSQVGDPVAQANLLVDRCTNFGMLDLRPALDLEDNPPTSDLPNIPDSQKADWAISFGRQVAARGHGFTLYANDSTWQIIYNKVMNAMPGTFRWVARYRVAPPVTPYDAWQYTSSGAVPGIAAGTVDRNRGAVPTNGGTMLDDADKQWLKTNTETNIGWWYNPRFRGNINYAQALQGMQDDLTGLKTSVVNMTNLIIADDANDVTADAVAQAVKGIVVSEITPAVVAAVTAATEDLEVDVDTDQIVQDVLDGFHARLES